MDGDAGRATGAELGAVVGVAVGGSDEDTEPVYVPVAVTIEGSGVRFAARGKAGLEAFEDAHRAVAEIEAAEPVEACGGKAQRLVVDEVAGDRKAVVPALHVGGRAKVDALSLVGVQMDAVPFVQGVDRDVLLHRHGLVDGNVAYAALGAVEAIRDEGEVGL